MKKILFLLPFVGILGYIMLTSSASGPGAVSGAGDRTGATGGTVGCGTIGLGCHSNTATSKIGVVVQLYDASGTTLIVPVQYTAGTNYILRVTGTNSGASTLPKFGFQLTTVKGTPPASSGTLTAIASTHLGVYSGINIVEHGSALAASPTSGLPGCTYTVSIPWKAPVAGTGTVTAYAVLNAVNGLGSADASDLWNTATPLPIPEATSSVAPITGTMTVCTGATTALTDATPGGTWSSSATPIATVGTTGIVTGVAVGTATISYITTSGNATTTVTVNTATPAAIMGASVVCVGMHIVLSDPTPGGGWASGTSSVATAGSATGVITGVAVGTSVITYGMFNSCGIGTATMVVSVHAASGCVSGATVNSQLNAALKVFPNPNTGLFTVNVLSIEDLQADYTITNIVGATVKQFTATTNKPVEVTLDRPTGIYFITAKTIHGVYVSRVVLQ